MTLKNTSLIGTFIDAEEITPNILRDIVERFQINKIFIFKVEDQENKFLITFNIRNFEKDEKLRDYKEVYKNTIQLHRNKDNNTLFTINSLNRVVEQQTGTRNSKHKVDWSSFKNSCVLLGNDGSLKIMKTVLSDIVDFS